MDNTIRFYNEITSFKNSILVIVREVSSGHIIGRYYLYNEYEKRVNGKLTVARRKVYK